MKKRSFLSGLMALLLTGCISYAAVNPGTLEYGSLEINTTQAWNLAPKEFSPSARPGSKLWTQDGFGCYIILLRCKYRKNQVKLKANKFIFHRIMHDGG